MWAWMFFFMHACVAVSWTVRLCIMPVKHEDVFKGAKGVIGLLLDIINIIMLFILIFSEIRDYLRAQKYTTWYGNTLILAINWL